jgi:flagellar protein FliS
MVKKMFKSYIENEVLSASKDKLIQLVYDKILIILNLVVKNLEENDILEAHNNMIKAETIIFHLINHLDFNAGRISNNLFKIYEFSLHELKKANINKDPAVVKNIIEVFKNLSEAWTSISEKRVNRKDIKLNEKLNYSI